MNELMNSCIHWWIIKRNPDLWFVDNGLQHQQDRLPIRIQSQQSCLRRIFFHKFCLRRILFHQKRHFISVSYSSLVYRFIDIQRDSIQILSDHKDVITKRFNSNTQWSQRKGSALQVSRRIVDLITTELQALSTPSCAPVVALNFASVASHIILKPVKVPLWRSVTSDYRREVICVPWHQPWQVDRDRGHEEDRTSQR